MRKTVLAMILALMALAVISVQAAAMEGFDLGDMPPLPPPLLDDSPAPAPVAPPASGPASPLTQGGSMPSLPPGFGTTDAALDASTPAPPPLAPPPILDSASTAPLSGQAATSPLGQIGAPPSTDAAAAPVVLNETPRNGRIEGGRVNVRAGPNTQYESIAVLGSGSQITVLAKHGDWYKIAFPLDQLASIHKSNVTADITGEIPEAGLPGVVNSDKAPVHAFYWDKSTVVGHLNQGDPVVIKQERGQWYRIVPPENARAYVFAQYVRVDGNVAADAAPAPENPSIDLAGGSAAPGERKLSESDKKVNAIKEAYFKRIQEAYEAEREAQERETERRIKEYTEKQKAQANQLENALKDLDSRLEAIDQEKSDRMGHIANVYQPTIVTGIGGANWAPPDPVSGGFTGWVENIGRVGGAPSSFRLTKGGEIRFYLRSDRINLNEFVNRRVWLNGSVEPAGGASAGMLNVDRIRILTELEVAEDMRSSAEQPYQAAPTYVDPYAGATVVQPAAPAFVADPYAGGTGAGYVDPYAPGGAFALPGSGNVGGTFVLPDSVGTADLIVPVAPGATTVPNYATATDPYAALYSTTIYGNDASAGSVVSAQPVQPAQPVLDAPFQGGDGPVPSDPSQLPDVVGAGGYRVGISSSGADVTLQGSAGEVETDFYEKPVIQEIAP